MIIYDYYEDITLEQLNVLGSANWEVIFMKDGDPLKLDVWVKKGFSDLMDYPPKEQYALIENTETGAEFYLNKSFTYGDAIIITFFTIFLLAFLGKIIFNYFFHNE